MLRILQTRNIEKYDDIIEKLGISDEIVSVAEATEEDKVTGFGVYYFDADKKEVVIRYAQYTDLMLADGIYRSILFLAMMRGIDKAQFVLNDEKLICDVKKLRLADENGIAQSISELLDGCKNCKNAE